MPLNLINYNTSVQSTSEVISNYMANNFQSVVSTDYKIQAKGIIKSVLLRDDVVFAVIERTVESEDSHGHEGLFNTYSYEHSDTMTFPELFIPTDIVPISNDISRWIGKPALVTVQNNIAIFASVLQVPEFLTTIKPSTIRAVREKLQDTSEGDIFSEAGQKIWDSFGILPEAVQSLKNMLFKVEEHSDKVITIEGEGGWHKDTSQVQDNEVVVPSEGFVGLNQQGMKSNKCHNPTRIFSAK